MPSRINRQFPPADGRHPAPHPMGPIPASAPQPDTRNQEGFPAWNTTYQKRVAEVLMLGNFGNAFYASGRELSTEALKVLRQAIVTDPTYVAKAAVLAREEGYIRSAPIMALALLTAGNQEAKDAACRIYLRILRTGDDLRNFVAFVQSGAAGREFGGLAQRIARDWLRYRLDEYQAMKYSGSGEKLSLRNLLRLTHPRAVAPWRNAVYKWLVKGEINAELIPSIRALESIARLKNEGAVTAEYVASTIRNHRLPYEAVVPRLAKKDTATMTALAAVAPYFNLLRGLNEFGRAGVWNNPGAVSNAITTLTNPEIIAKTHLFPFRFLTAVRAIENNLERFVPDSLIEALYRALELSLANAPVLPGRVVVAPDVSYSMNMPVGKFTSAAEIGAMFAAALWKSSPGVEVMPFNTQVQRMTTSRLDSLMTITQSIGQMVYGGTDLSVPLRSLLLQRHPVDLYIGLTDNQDWAGPGFFSTWSEYRRRVNPAARAILVTLVPYGDRPTPPNHPDIQYVYGWSDAVLRYVGDAARLGDRGDRPGGPTGGNGEGSGGGSALVERVQNVSLSHIERSPVLRSTTNANEATEAEDLSDGAEA